MKQTQAFEGTHLQRLMKNQPQQGLNTGCAEKNRPFLIQVTMQENLLK
jgi:hypothetical protein